MQFTKLFLFSMSYYNVHFNTRFNGTIKHSFGLQTTMRSFDQQFSGSHAIYALAFV